MPVHTRPLLNKENGAELRGMYRRANQKVTTSEVLRYASDHGVHPAIVAGRIQHTKKDFRTFANLVGHNEVRKYFPLGGWSKAIPKEEVHIE